MVRVRNPRGGGDRLRIEIIEAATRLLAMLGEREALSIRAVAKEAGIAPTSVYLHFADKDEIVVAVLARLFAELAAARDAAENAAPGAGPWERLLARSLAYVCYGIDNPGHYKVLYEGRAVPRVDAPEVAPLGQPMLDRTIELVNELVAARLAEPVADADRTGLLLWIALHGVVSLRINKDTIAWPAPAALAEQLARAIVRPKP